MSTPRRAKGSPKTPISFDTWFDQLETLANERRWNILEHGKECWREYHLDGDSPIQALLHDMLVNRHSPPPS